MRSPAQIQLVLPLPKSWLLPVGFYTEGCTRKTVKGIWGEGVGNARIGKESMEQWGAGKELKTYA